MIAALNNLAPSKVRDRRVNAAFVLWEEVNKAGVPVPAEVLHNVARTHLLISKGEADRSPIYLQASKQSTRRCEELLLKLASRNAGPQNAERTGWLYMVPDGGEDVARAVSGSSGWRACEDRWCMRREGDVTVDCSNSKCKKGTVRAYRTVRKAINTPAGRIYKVE